MFKSLMSISMYLFLGLQIHAMNQEDNLKHTSFPFETGTVTVFSNGDITRDTDLEMVFLSSVSDHVKIKTTINKITDIETIEFLKSNELPDLTKPTIIFNRQDGTFSSKYSDGQDSLKIDESEQTLWCGGGKTVHFDTHAERIECDLKHHNSFGCSLLISYYQSNNIRQIEPAVLVENCPKVTVFPNGTCLSNYSNGDHVRSNLFQYAAIEHRGTYKIKRLVNKSNSSVLIQYLNMQSQLDLSKPSVRIVLKEKLDPLIENSNLTHIVLPERQSDRCYLVSYPDGNSSFVDSDKLHELFGDDIVPHDYKGCVLGFEDNNKKFKINTLTGDREEIK